MDGCCRISVVTIWAGMGQSGAQRGRGALPACTRGPLMTVTPSLPAPGTPISLSWFFPTKLVPKGTHVWVSAQVKHDPQSIAVTNSMVNVLSAPANEATHPWPLSGPADPGGGGDASHIQRTAHVAKGAVRTGGRARRPAVVITMATSATQSLSCHLTHYMWPLRSLQVPSPSGSEP